MAEEKKDFIVKDRRIFAEETSEQKKESEKKEPAADTAKGPAAKATAAAEEPKEEPQLPEINFSTFIFSLNASCLVQLGIIEDPAAGKNVKNLALAKQTIDILSLLEEKTRGNLTKEEENMLKSILYDLRISYVREKK